MKKIAVNFAGGSYSLKMSQIRLRDQIKQYFDGVAEFDENHPFIIELTRKYPQIYKYRRGFGYWSWKPFIIRYVLQQLEDGDIAFYMDVGNDIVSSPENIFNLCKENKGVVLFENRSGNPNGEIWKNAHWTKMDCFKLMKCDSKKYYYGNQVDGAYLVFEKNKFTMDLLDEYCNFAVDPRIITDEPNVVLDSENFGGFVDHRHDQSIISLLAIKYNLKLYPEPSEVGDITEKERQSLGYSRVFFHHRGTIYGRR